MNDPAYMRQYRKDNAARLAYQDWAGALRRNYGITPAQYEQFFSEQDGCCGLCGREAGERKLHVDHDHESGVVRGLLCVNCNTALGTLGDNPEGLRRALAWTERGLS